MVVIRPEEPSDVDAIRDLIRDAFKDAAHRSGTEQAIVDGLRAARALSISLVAVKRGAIVGHVAVSPVSTEDSVGEWFGLGPVSVQPGSQMQGIGSALIREALERLRDSGSAGCVVLGDPTYYGRFGFEHDPSVLYRDVPPPYFQILSIGTERPAGQVEYHPAFDAAD